MEPNSYCVATATLLILRRELMNKSLDLLSFVAIATMVLSLSLWGALIAIFISCYHYLRLSQTLKGRLRKWLCCHLFS